MVTDPASAETIKYASNAFLATKLSFVNAVAARVRGGRRRRQRRGARHGLRQAHRPRVPAARPGLGRQLLPEGRAGAASTSPRTPATTSTCWPAWSSVNEEQFDRVADKIAAMAGGSLDGSHRRRVGPHLQGQHRRPPRVAVAAHHRPAAATGAPSCAAYDPTVKDAAARGSRASRWSPIAYAACEGADVLARAHRVGRVQVARPRQGGRRRWPAADRRRPQPARPRRHPPPRASRTRASAGPDGPDRHHRRRRLPRLAPVRPRSSTGATRSSPSTTSSTGSVRATSSTSSADRGFTFVEHDVSQLRLGARRRSTPCCTSPARRRRSTTSSCPIQTLKVGSLGTHNTLGWPRPRAPASSWPRPARSTATPRSTRSPRSYWGNVNPIGPRGVYDEAKRFAEAHDDGVPPPPRPRRAHRAHLQHLRPAHAPRRRPGGVELPRAGAQGRAAHHLRRRQPDPQLLLRRRRGRAASWPCSTADAHRPGQHRQPRRVHRSRELADLVLEVTGSSLGDRVSSRCPVDDPTPAPARPHPRPRRAGLGARRSSCARASPAPPSTSARPSATAARGAQTARASASSRWARYQSRVRRRPSSNEVGALKPNVLGRPAGVDAAAGAGRRACDGVPADLAFEPDQLDDDLDELADGQLVVGAEVDRLVAVVALGGQHDAVGGVVDVEELAAGRAGAPHSMWSAPRLLGVDAAS